MKLMTGVVSKIHRATETHGSVQNGKGSIRTGHAATFLLSSLPVLLRGSNPIFISDGDRVSVVVDGKPTSLQAHCYHNHTTGVVGPAPYGTVLTVALFMLLFGLLTMWFYVGYLLLGLSALLLHRAWKLWTATQWVRAADPSPLPEAAAG